MRHHGDLARIELAPTTCRGGAREPLRGQVEAAVRAAGFGQVTIDPAGLQSGRFTLRCCRSGVAERARLGPRLPVRRSGPGPVDPPRLPRGGLLRRTRPSSSWPRSPRRSGDQTDTVNLFTRASAEQAKAILTELPDAFLDLEAGLLAWPAEPPEPTGGLVVVLTAGTSDLPMAREALLTARYLGRPTELVVDVGVAGLHRVLDRLPLLRRARVIIVAAGMDGALPSVVAGLVSAPVVALPTSVGYGAAFGGLAPLLAMLNSCAPGVAVVNIDNGYGAGHLAAQIAAPAMTAAGPTRLDRRFRRRGGRHAARRPAGRRGLADGRTGSRRRRDSGLGPGRRRPRSTRAGLRATKAELDLDRGRPTAPVLARRSAVC